LETKLTASDATVDDRFGVSVAISGNTALVGAVGDDDGGSASGSAYLFDVTTGNQIAKLTASDAALGDEFGVSVAISGNTALVGARFDDDGGIASGSAYLFDVTTGNQTARLTASDAALGDEFGVSVAISGNRALVGARFDDDGGSFSGSAYLFDVTTGNQIAKLTASDATAGDWFGSSVAISGNTALIGAVADDDRGSLSGSAYLFDVTTGNQIAKLTASDAAEGDVFGSSVAISGDTALVGAWGDDDGGNNSGSVYLFDVTTGNQIAKLTASDAAGGDLFGFSVAISGNAALVGANGDDDAGDASGSAYLFKSTLQPGDFDDDGDVDGADFLRWQRGGSPDSLSAEDLADWEDNFGTAPNTLAASAASSTTVPEPSALLLLLIGCLGGLRCEFRIFSTASS